MEWLRIGEARTDSVQNRRLTVQATIFLAQKSPLLRSEPNTFTLYDNT